jgi:hypothetical protein
LQQATGHGGSVASRPLSLLLLSLLLLLLLMMLVLVLVLLLIIRFLLLLLSVLKLSLGEIGKHSWIDALWYRHVVAHLVLFCLDGL